MDEDGVRDLTAPEGEPTGNHLAQQDVIWTDLRRVRLRSLLSAQTGELGA